MRDEPFGTLALKDGGEGRAERAKRAERVEEILRGTGGSFFLPSVPALGWHKQHLHDRGELDRKYFQAKQAERVEKAHIETGGSFFLPSVPAHTFRVSSFKFFI